MPRIDWKRVWKDFDSWCESRQGDLCPECKRNRGEYPDWEEQMRRIQKLVNKQIGGKREA